MLQDYIRMLDGRNEIAEDLCFGVKALRDIVYFKTLSKVDFENWWKEFSTFIIAPLRRTTSRLKGKLIVRFEHSNQRGRLWPEEVTFFLDRGRFEK